MNTMTASRAWHLRRPALQAAVDAGSRCNGLDPDLFFRGDGEQHITWQARRTEAVRVCATCPARAACRELALRDADGDAQADDRVRGGLTGPELADTRDRQEQRLAAASATDRDQEWATLVALTKEMRTKAVRSPRVRELAEQARTIRTARRARAGWSTAA
ncbi:WhiB family transcriptional regulator [Streptomyces sp. NPDC006733]|uniref:WhiB family transcriptional regulator n=1 Tax=Streptomyces sp. NPDC006733 TaxID=3155460 RepID=UPI003405BC53